MGQHLIGQWNPTHRTRCHIYGLAPLAFGLTYDFGQKFTKLKIYKSPPPSRLDYGIQGGCFDFRTLTLEQLYQDHLLGRNIWSKGNEGYDLARYKGTKFYLPPHETIPYIFSWERNWTRTENEQIPFQHPYWLLLHRKHTKFIPPRSWGNKRSRRVFVRPPTLQQTMWYYTSSWSGVALVRFGITPVNIKNPFIKGPTSGSQNRAIYAPFIGWAQDSQNMPPTKIAWNEQAMAGFNTMVLYRWWWDDGIDNYIMLNTTNADPGADNQQKIVAINMPYWQFFWGSHYPTSKDTIPAVYNTNQSWSVGINPSPYAILWYKDAALKDTHGGLFMDTRYLRPSDLPTPTKVWVMLWPVLANTGSTSGGPQPENIKPNTGAKRDDGFNELTVTTSIQRIIAAGPYVMTAGDIPGGEKMMNFPYRYQSYWEWGGVSPKPDDVTDPRGEPSMQPTAVQVRNPATVGNYALHPWDLTSDGLITKQKLQALLAQYSAGPHQLPETARQQEAPRRSPEIEGEPWQSESSPSSGDASPVSSDTPSDEEETADLDPHKTRRLLRKLLRHRRHGDDKLRKLKRVIYSLAT